MKVALLAPYLSRVSGGLSHAVPGLVGAFEARTDCEPHVVGILDRRHPDDWRAWGTHVHPTPAHGPRAFGWGPSMRRCLFELAPAIIDVQGLWMSPSLATLRHTRKTGTPHVITPHGMLDPWALRRSTWNKQMVRWWFENAHLRRAACLRATAPMEAEHFRAFGLRQPIAVVPNGVEVTDEDAGMRSARETRRLLFLSRIHPKKGIPFLLRAWAELAPRHPAWELVIAGPDEVGHKAAMQELAAQRKLERLTWLDAVDGGAKTALYRSADLFVLPTHAENFGLVVAEALAQAVPVVTTRNAPWSGLEQHGCGWWIELTEQQLIEALDAGMRCPDDERLAMGRRGRAWMARDFAWSAIAQQMLEVYRWVAGGGDPPTCVITEA